MSVKVYAGNLDQGTSDESIREAFSMYGVVLEASVMRDPDTGLSRGFGFITFSNANDASSAISGLNEQEYALPLTIITGASDWDAHQFGRLDGRRMKVRLANAR